MRKIRVSVLTPSIRPEGLERVAEGLRVQTLQDYEWLIEINTHNVVDLNAAMNRMLRRAKGELIVFLQDFIKIEPDGLEKFWLAYQNKHAFYTAPVGKMHNGLEVYDWRKAGRVECDWKVWEIDWGAAPRDYLFNIGGFDERLDEAWGFDNVNVGLRADMAGYKFFNIPANPAIAIDHDKIMHHPFRELRDPDLHNQRLDEIRRGVVQVDYLT